MDLGHVNEHLEIRQQQQARIDYYLMPLSTSGKHKGQMQDRSMNAEKRKLIFSITSTYEKIYAKPHVLRCLEARLQYYNKGGIVQKTGIIQIESNENKLLQKIYDLKTAVSTSKRMITKMSNKITQFENYQAGLLINDLNNPKYLKYKEKLENYKRQLVLDEAELKAEEIKQFKNRLGI